MNVADVNGQGLRSGSAAEFAGLTVRAVRYYQRCGLVHPTRDESRYWRYPPVQLARLVRIRALRELGLGLEQIGALLDGAGGDVVGALDVLRADLRSRATVLARMADTVEQVLTGTSGAQLSMPWKELVATARIEARVARASAFGGADQGGLVELLDSAPVVEALARLAPRLRALKDAPPDSPEVDSLAIELVATLPAALLPTAVTDAAMLTVLLGPHFSAAQLRCVLDAGESAHPGRPAGRIGGSR